jgi:hypothetical protein
MRTVHTSYKQAAVVYDLFYHIIQGYPTSCFVFTYFIILSSVWFGVFLINYSIFLSYSPFFRSLDVVVLTCSEGVQ